ncbi:toll/interleukin-1 receptor domain-containing protein [Agrobacterium tumefaciens]|nr:MULTISPECIES: toll/interleukin-1 receptor domain-containing protein [Agrobacterium]
MWIWFLNRSPWTRFFFSYNGADRKWAEWIGHEVEDAGHLAILQAWDFLPGTNFVLQMQDAAKTTDKTILVLSPDYLTSQFAASEWAAAFRTDPEGLKQKLLPIMVRQCEPQGLLSSIVYVDVCELGEDEAREVVRNAIAGKRGKPSANPVFPGTNRQEAGNFAVVAAQTGATRQKMPSLSVRHTDLDRKNFLRDGFSTIRRVFERNSKDVRRKEPRIQVDIEMNTNTDLRAEIFVDAMSVNACRVWLGGFHGSTSITFSEGRNFSDNSFSEMLTVEEDSEFYLKATMAMGYQQVSVDVKRMTPEEAGQYLWERLVARLSQA